MGRWIFKATLVLGLVALAAGCQSGPLRLPAIDPSGERVFTPGASTQLVAPVSPNALAPQPAWVAPPNPSPCLMAPAPHSAAVDPCSAAIDPCNTAFDPCDLAFDPCRVAPVPCGTMPVPYGAAPQRPGCNLFGHCFRNKLPEAPGAEPRLVLSPARIVAPVSSEVVLAAGVCAATGKCQTQEKVEWTLSQESVGAFVEVGDDGGSWCRLAKHRDPEKLSNNFARGKTSAREQLLNRGTPNPADDLLLPAGQAFVTVTSAVEGVSNVTVFAPETEGWDRRQQTAQVFWIDAQWLFPAPAIARAGERAILTTNVSRLRTGDPVAGWNVLYEITGGAPASLDGQGAQSRGVMTDAGGNASVEVFPAAIQQGAAQIRMQIVRPALPGSNLPQLVVGTGYTNVAWTAPGLEARITGPQQLDVGGTGVYQIDIANPGDMATAGVTLTDELPPGLTLVNSTPPAQVFGNRLEWNLGELAPRTNRSLQVTCRAESQGDVRHCVRARSGAGLTHEACTPTLIRAQALSVTLSGPTEAAAGQEVQYQIVVTNRGQQRLTNVLISDRFDAGFRHALAVSPIEKSLGDLNPGESRNVAITFLVVGSGRICHTVTLTADGGQTATAQGCVTVAPGAAAPPFGGNAPAPAAGDPLRLEISNAESRRVGERVQFAVRVTNLTQLPVSNLQIGIAHSPGLAPAGSNPPMQRNAAGLFWNMGTLAAGQMAEGLLECQCAAADPAAFLRASVTSSAGSQTGEGRLRIDAANAEGANTSLAPPGEVSAPGGGQLVLSLADQGDPTRVGGEVTYLVSVRNDRAESDKRIVLAVSVPAGLTIASLDSRIAPNEAARRQGVIEFQPIAELRPGETFSMRFVARATQAGRQLVRVEATSLRHSQPVTVEEESTVFAE